MGGNAPFFFMALKQLREGEEFPDDFWNYDVNVILGYRLRDEGNWKEQTRKYAIKPNGDIR